MKSVFLTLSVLIVFMVTPMLVSAQTYQAAGTTPPPPVSQPLVREGTLAMELAVQLKAGNPSTETEAESLLTAAGIAPRNGWVADYPVTPDIIAELNNSISVAADSGAILLSEVEARRAFEAVLSGYNLNVRTDVADGTIEVPPQEDYPDTTLVNNYYYDQGPPVVTYYAPPPDYFYLYTWVPYPFWWWNFWFPGFYVLADFDIVVHGHHGHDGHGHHDGHHGHGEFISNHFRDPGTGKTSRINPAARSTGGTFADRGISRGWTTQGAERSARAIYKRNSNSLSSGNKRVFAPSRTGSERSAPVNVYRGRSSRSSYAPGGGRTYGNATYNRSRSFNRSAYATPGSGSSSYYSPPVGRSERYFSRPSQRAPYAGSSSFRAPAVSQRSFGSAATFNAPSRSGFSSGGAMRSSFGSSFGGGGSSSFGRGMRR